jgi:hypothetical protein
MTAVAGRRPRGLARTGRLAVLAGASAFTVLLAQHTTTAAFTAQTGDTGNQATTATTFCTSPGTSANLAPTRDTAIYEVNANANYSATGIGVGTGASGDAYTLLKFTLPTIPARCTVTAATLYVYAKTPTAPATVNAYRSTQAWTNSNTWNTLPRPGWTGTPASTAVSASAGWLSWDVKTLTQELVNGPDYGFLLKDSVDHHPTVTRYQTWESLESYPTRAPYLVVSWG